MSAQQTALYDYAVTLRLRIPRYMHPTVYEYCDEMEDAARRDDVVQFKRYLSLMQDAILRELCWEAENCETARCYKEAYKLRRQADRIAGIQSDPWQSSWAEVINRKSAERARQHAQWHQEEIARYGHIRTLDEYLEDKRRCNEQHA